MQHSSLLDAFIGSMTALVTLSVLTFVYWDVIEPIILCLIVFIYCQHVHSLCLSSKVYRFEERLKKLEDQITVCEPRYQRSVKVMVEPWIIEACKTNPLFNQIANLQYKTIGSAALDLVAPTSFTLPVGGEVVTVRTGIHVQPDDPRIHAVILPRSGLGSKGMVIMNTVGLIDNDYTGEILLKLSNRGSKEISVSQFGRFAQMMFLSAIQAELVQVDSLTTTDRGDGGFGSTGMHVEI